MESQVNNPKNITPDISEEQEIDLLELARKVWKDRMLVLKWCGIALVVAIVVAYSIPKEYTTTVTLAPEISGTSSRSLGNMSALAAMAGLRTSSGSSNDALSPELYPDIVSSTAFAVELFDVPVQDASGELQTTVYDYLTAHQRAPWWSTVMSLPSRLIGWVPSLFKSDDELVNDEGKVDPFQLTFEQSGVVGALNGRITASVDKKSWVITLSVTMQDPLISATLTDTVMHKLQNYITDYRTNKARKDLEFSQKVYEEARDNYYDSQQAYADFVDRNQGIMRKTMEAKEERLRNEMTLDYTLYNQTAQQLQLAKAKVQENTPVYTVVQPATVPLLPSKPSKMLILVAFVFLGGVCSVGWILFGRDLWHQLKMKKSKK